jgi:hypothetical protein
MRNAILFSARFLFSARWIFLGALVLILSWSMQALADAPAAQPAAPVAAQVPAPQAAPPKPADQAAQLVQKALMAEADGKPDVRANLLQEALTVAPDFAPAHWQSGEILSRDQWTSIDDAAKQDAHSAKLDEYRKLRDAAGATVDEQLNLARWCEKAGLKDQQRAHLMFALQLQPKNKEAISKLGLVRYRGQLVPAKQLDEIKAEEKQSQTESKEWKARIDGWRQVLQDRPKSAHEDVLNQIRAVRDPAAIHLLERDLAHSGEDAYLAVVEALASMPQQAATDVLIRAALFSPYEHVSRNAIYALRSRSLFGYVPLLIAKLQAPIKVEYDVLNFDSQNFTHELLLSQEYADHEDVRLDFSSTTNTSPLVTVGQGNQIAPASPDMSAMRTLAVAAQQRQNVNVVLNAVQQTNDQTAKSNAALTTLLSDTTGQQLGNDAVAWWEWWYDYNGYYRPDEMPTNYSGSATNNYYSNPRYQYAYTHSPADRCECFVAGTSVWTTGGQMPIESVKVGELVLAQDPKSGELAYKPVIYLTTRPKTPLIEAHLGNTVILASRGHPFWVDGLGWQMAKELKAGQWLHTANGPVQIDSAEPSDEAVCYNLVVADFHDYFVSDAKVLVHDNLLRGPTLATVPGLAEAK